MWRTPTALLAVYRPQQPLGLEPLQEVQESEHPASSPTPVPMEANSDLGATDSSNQVKQSSISENEERISSIDCSNNSQVQRVDNNKEAENKVEPPETLEKFTPLSLEFISGAQESAQETQQPVQGTTQENPQKPQSPDLFEDEEADEFKDACETHTDQKVTEQPVSAGNTMQSSTLTNDSSVNTKIPHSESNPPNAVDSGIREETRANSIGCVKKSAEPEDSAVTTLRPYKRNTMHGRYNSVSLTEAEQEEEAFDCVPNLQSHHHDSDLRKSINKHMSTISTASSIAALVPFMFRSKEETGMSNDDGQQPLLFAAPGDDLETSSPLAEKSNNYSDGGGSANHKRGAFARLSRYADKRHSRIFKDKFGSSSKKNAVAGAAAQAVAEWKSSLETSFDGCLGNTSRFELSFPSVGLESNKQRSYTSSLKSTSNNGAKNSVKSAKSSINSNTESSSARSESKLEALKRKSRMLFGSHSNASTRHLNENFNSMDGVPETNAMAPGAGPSSTCVETSIGTFLDPPSLITDNSEMSATSNGSTSTRKSRTWTFGRGHKGSSGDSVKPQKRSKMQQFLSLLGSSSSKTYSPSRETACRSARGRLQHFDDEDWGLF